MILALFIFGAVVSYLLGFLQGARITAKIAADQLDLLSKELEHEMRERNFIA